MLQGHHDGAREKLTQSEAVLHEPGVERAPFMNEFVRPWLALFAYVSDDVDAARATAAETVRIGRARGSRWDESLGEWLLSRVAHRQDNNDDARAHQEASRALSSAPRLPFPLGRSLLGLADLAREGGDLHQTWELAH